MARFISRYTNHRLKGPGGIIEFEQNECVLHDEAKCEYLRKHPDFGVAIFEDENQQEQPKEYVCQNCGKEFKSPQGYASHVKACKEKLPDSDGSESEEGEGTEDPEGEE